jgi:hypothetical protein
MRAIKTIIVGALLAGYLAGPVYAQGMSPEKDDESPLKLEEKQKRLEAASVDKQYKSTLQRTRGNGSTAAAPADDPWSNMRGTTDTKPKR